jgi:hypothetical protein
MSWVFVIRAKCLISWLRFFNNSLCLNISSFSPSSIKKVKVVFSKIGKCQKIKKPDPLQNRAFL